MWPLLLGVYPVDSTVEERAAIDRANTQSYESVLAAWRAAETLARRLREATDGLRMKRPNNPTINGETLHVPGHTPSHSPSPTGHTPSPSLSTNSDLSTTSSGLPPGDRASRCVLECTGEADLGRCVPASPDLPDGASPDPPDGASPDPPDGGKDGVVGENCHSNGYADSLPSVRSGSCGLSCISREEEKEEEEEEVEVEDAERVAEALSFAEELVKIDKDVPRCDRDYP